MAKLGKEAQQGGAMLYAGTPGEPLAMMNASAITAIRTAAVSAVATRILAREDACDLTIIGAGGQGRSHLAAMSCVRSLKRARIVSRNFEHAQQFVRDLQERYAFPLSAVESVEDAVRDAELIVTATTSYEPVLRREWISRGAHINAIGTYSRNAREIDSATMAAATLIVDARESALNEAGDYLIAESEGAIGPDSIRAELGEILIGSAPGRASREEITLFKSLGLAIEDLATASYLYQKAGRENAGTWVEF